jgi:riboflavin synthase
MFTGIVSELGEVVSLRRQGSGAVLTVRAAAAKEDSAIGDSIAINGACLTVTRIDGSGFEFDISAETINSTTLGGFSAGDRVNIEQSLRADGKLGGHFVTGHVDIVGKIRSKIQEGETYKFEIQAAPWLAGFLVEKGSVAVDGISLTVVDVFDDYFTLVIIPHTAAVTTLGFKSAGDTVNLEADIIGKYVKKFLNKKDYSGKGLMETLKEEGFTT